MREDTCWVNPGGGGIPGGGGGMPGGGTKATLIVDVEGDGESVLLTKSYFGHFQVPTRSRF